MSMVSYRLIGSGTTDEHGVAHITKDAEGQTLATPGYTGVGAGEIDVVASADNPIVSGSVVSEPFTVDDTLVWDRAIDGDKNTNFNTGSGLTVTLQTEDTLISCGRTYNTNGMYISLTGLTGDFQITLQTKTSTNTRFGVSDTTSQNGNLSVINYNAGSSWKDIKIIRQNGVYTAYKKSIDSETWESQTISDNNAGTGTVYFLIYIYNSSTSVTQSCNYRNLRIIHI